MPAAETSADPDPPADEPFPFTFGDAIADLERTVAYMKANGGGLPPDHRTTRLIGEPPYDVTVQIGNAIYRVGVGEPSGSGPADVLRRAADRVEAAA